MLDRSKTMPLHQQLEELIRNKLANREWPSQQMIPSENELCDEYGVSRGTVRNVISKLVYEGLFERVPGKGTFVKETKIELPSSRSGIRGQLEINGNDVETKLVSLERSMVNHTISKRFFCSADDEFFIIVRKRSLRGIPLQYGVSYFPCHLVPDLDKHFHEDLSLRHFLQDRYALQPIRTEETLESVPAGKDCAEMLAVKVGFPLLLLEETVYDKDDVPFEHSLITFRGDRIRIRISL